MPARYGEMQHSVLAAGRAKAVLGWTPETTIEEGMQRTVAWVRDPSQNRC